MQVDRFDVRTSSRRVLRRCLRKWGFQSSMRMGLERIGAETNINFWFGSAIHFAMEDYFGWNHFGDPRRAFKAYYEAFKPEDRPEGADIHYDLGLAMLNYFLEWYPKHNNDMQFQTLWFDDNNQPVAPNSPGGHPAVEQEFLFDMGYKVIVDATTGDLIKEWLPLEDKLYSMQDFNYEIDTPIPAEKIQTGEGATHYYYNKVDSYIGPDHIKHVTFKTIEVKIVPVCYHGTMDRLCIDRWGRWWILDYKTAKGADTRKLDTDDQITSYLWAAEQKYNHPFYGFIYLQLTKDVAKLPKRLKDGSLSVDKKQKTTYALYKAEVLADYGSVQKSPGKIIEMLNHLADLEEPEGDRFIRWDFVQRNDAQKVNMYENIKAEIKTMLDVDKRLYPSPTRDCGWDCPFREICIAMDRGEDVREMINMSFQRRSDTLEHNEDAWRDKIKWPETPLEAASLDDKDLRPENIFNLELPPEYYSHDYDE